MSNNRVLLIYNPNAGNKSFTDYKDHFVDVFQNKGYQTHAFKTENKEDFSNLIRQKNLRDYQGLFIAGGDGSIHYSVNALMNVDTPIPIGVIPAGTMNDYSYNLDIPNNIERAIEKLSSMEVKLVDLARVNDRYFVNTCGAGLFMDIPHQTETQLKNILGRTAYYITGIKELPNFKKLHLHISYDGKSVEDKFYFFIIMNGSSAGGFHQLGYKASVTDGYLDFIGIKACPLSELSLLFAKILLGTHLDDKNIYYFKAKSISIYPVDHEKEEFTDVDGEKGPFLPLHMKILPKHLQVIVPVED